MSSDSVKIIQEAIENKLFFPLKLVDKEGKFTFKYYLSIKTDGNNHSLYEVKAKDKQYNLEFVRVFKKNVDSVMCTPIEIHYLHFTMTKEWLIQNKIGKQTVLEDKGQIYSSYNTEKSYFKGKEFQRFVFKEKESNGWKFKTFEEAQVLISEYFEKGKDTIELKKSGELIFQTQDSVNESQELANLFGSDVVYNQNGIAQEKDFKKTSPEQALSPVDLNMKFLKEVCSYLDLSFFDLVGGMPSSFSLEYRNHRKDSDIFHLLYSNNNTFSLFKTEFVKNFRFLIEQKNISLEKIISPNFNVKDSLGLYTGKPDEDILDKLEIYLDYLKYGFESEKMHRRQEELSSSGFKGFTDSEIGIIESVFIMTIVKDFTFRLNVFQKKNFLEYAHTLAGMYYHQSLASLNRTTFKLNIEYHKDVNNPNAQNFMMVTGMSGTDSLLMSNLSINFSSLKQRGLLSYLKSYFHEIAHLYTLVFESQLKYKERVDFNRFLPMAIDEGLSNSFATFALEEFLKLQGLGLEDSQYISSYWGKMAHFYTQDMYAPGYSIVHLPFAVLGQTYFKRNFLPILMKLRSSELTYQEFMDKLKELLTKDTTQKEIFKENLKEYFSLLRTVK